MRCTLVARALLPAAPGLIPAPGFGRLVGLLLLAASTAAAQSTVSGPSLGVVYDPVDQAIRPILGIPGAATAANKINAGFAITAAAIPPTHDFAVAVSTDGSLQLVTLAAAGPSAQAISAAATPDRVVLSPAGSAAVLYYKSAMAVQAVTGLPGTASTINVSQQLDISGLPQPPDTWAISDDGTVLLAGVIENASGNPARGEVFLIPTDGTAVRSIGAVQHASALTFFKASHDVLITDDAANTITIVSDAAGQAGVSWTFSDAGLQAPDSVQPSPDGNTIFAGSSTNSVLALLDRTGTNPPVYVSCQCAPKEVRPFKPPAIYQVTEPSNGLLWIFDGNPQNPRVLFVPVPTDSSAGSGQ